MNTTPPPAQNQDQHHPACQSALRRTRTIEESGEHDAVSVRAYRAAWRDVHERYCTPQPDGMFGAVMNTEQAPATIVAEGLIGTATAEAVMVLPAEMSVLAAVRVMVGQWTVSEQTFAAHGRQVHTICHWPYDPSEVESLLSALDAAMTPEKFGGNALAERAREIAREIVTTWASREPEHVQW